MTVEESPLPTPEQIDDASLKYQEQQRVIKERNAPYIRAYNEMIDQLLEAQNTGIEGNEGFRSTLAKLVHSLPQNTGIQDEFYYRRIRLGQFWPEGFVYELNRADLTAILTSRCEGLTALSVSLSKTMEDVASMEAMLKVIGK